MLHFPVCTHHHHPQISASLTWFIVFSRYIIHKLHTPAPHPTDENFSSWARNLPTMFRSFAWREESPHNRNDGPSDQRTQNHRAPQSGTQAKLVGDAFELVSETTPDNNEGSIIVRERDLETGCTVWYSSKLECSPESQNDGILAA